MLAVKIAIELWWTCISQLVSWTDLITSTPDLETQFLKVLKTPRSTQLQVKYVLLKD